ncbi:hypothetical protein EC900091_2672, partial [Escherichia coli 90.0091]
IHRHADVFMLDFHESTPSDKHALQSPSA